jgi:hypothetical protein
MRRSTRRRIGYDGEHTTARRRMYATFTDMHLRDVCDMDMADDDAFIGRDDDTHGYV